MFAFGHARLSAESLFVFLLFLMFNTPARSAKPKCNLERVENMLFKCHLSLCDASKSSDGLTELTDAYTLMTLLSCLFVPSES